MDADQEVSPNRTTEFTHRSSNIAGRTLDADGNPVEGATVYLVSTYAPKAKDEYRVVATTTSSKEGSYEFVDVDLPDGCVDSDDSEEDVGAFEIFATAGGHGLAWIPEQDVDHADMDLHFTKPVTIEGRVVDENGKPLKDAEIELTHCTRLREGQPIVEVDELTSIFQGAAPTSLTHRKTDVDGRFQFTDLPHSARLRFIANSQGYARESCSAAALDAPDLSATKPLIHDGIVNFKMRPIKTVPIQVVYADSGQPADRVLLSVSGNGTSSSVTTDADGNGQLELPVGRYSNIILYPRIGTRYVRTKEARRLTVEQGDNELSVFEIEPASELEITIVDAKTREPIPGVTLEVDGREHGWRSWEVETNVSHYLEPVTDAKGKMSALVEPGKHKIGVRAIELQHEYELKEAIVELDCLASEAQAVEIKIEPTKH